MPLFHNVNTHKSTYCTLTVQTVTDCIYKWQSLLFCHCEHMQLCHIFTVAE